jgi:hypothetical protein
MESFRGGEFHEETAMRGKNAAGNRVFGIGNLEHQEQTVHAL